MNERTKTAQKVKATYEILATFKKVQLKVPGVNDKHFKFIAEHCIINGDQELVKVPGHYRRGDLFNGNFVTRNFYIHSCLIGQTIVADEVRVVAKTDHYRGKICLLLDIVKHDLKRIKPQFRLKCGSPTGDFLVPGTKDKFIKFEKI